MSFSASYYGGGAIVVQYNAPGPNVKTLADLTALAQVISDAFSTWADVEGDPVRGAAVTYPNLVQVSTVDA
jgi:hypothetical protein